jgi:hypothetical protein
MLASRQQYLFDKCLLLYVQPWTADDGRKAETCRVSFQNKINLIHWCYLVGFTIELYYDARPYGRQISPLCLKFNTNLYLLFNAVRRLQGAFSSTSSLFFNLCQQLHGTPDIWFWKKGCIADVWTKQLH